MLAVVIFSNFTFTTIAIFVKLGNNVTDSFLIKFMYKLLKTVDHIIGQVALKMLMLLVYDPLHILSLMTAVPAAKYILHG